MVRIDSTNGKEDTLARRLESRLKSFGIGKVWCEKTYEGRLNTLWKWTAAREASPVVHRAPRHQAGLRRLAARSFDGAIEDGRLHGHGVMDMKAGALVADRRHQDAGRQWRGFPGQDHVRGGGRSHGDSRPAPSICSGATSSTIACWPNLTDMQVYIIAGDTTSISPPSAARHACHKHLAINAIEKMLPVVDGCPSSILPRISAGDEGAVGRSSTSRSAASSAGCFRRSVDDPRPLHDRVDTRAAAGRSDRGGQGGHPAGARPRHARS